MTIWKKHKEATKNDRRKLQNIAEYIKVTPEELDFDIIQRRKDFFETTKRNSRKWYIKYYKYAAAIVIFLGLTYYYTVSSGSSDFGNSVIHTPVDVVTLTLDNGDVLKLDVNKEQKVLDMNEKLISNQVKNTLIYDVEASDKTRELVYNNLSIPNGQTFKLTLSDGTQIHLNAGSSLRYPIAFIKGLPRTVFLDGEGYFEVSKNKNDPFIVNAHELITKVYGTQFNVSAYKNDGDTRVVLIEGSVGVTPEKNNKSAKSVLLTPGQMASVSEVDMAVKVENVKIQNQISWIHGGLFLRSTSFELIMKKLERYFNVEIDIEYQKIANQKFSASFDNTDNTVQQILMYLSNSTPFSYEIKGNNITIYKP